MKVLLLISFLFMTACSIVGPGERGVRLKMGEAQDYVLEPGAHFWIPVFRGVAKVDVQIQKNEVVTPSASKDMQEIETNLAVNWHIEADQVVKLYKSVGHEYYILNRLIVPAVNEVLKATSAKLTAEEILTKRVEMKDDIDSSLRNRLLKYGIIIDEINIVDLTFSKEFTHAIEQKQIAEQEAKQAYYLAQKVAKDAEGKAVAQVTMAKADAEQRVIDAGAKAKSEVLAAKADAEAKLLRANAEAKANLTVAKSLTPALIKYEKIKNWNGQLPKVTGGAGTLISIDGDK